MATTWQAFTSARRTKCFYKGSFNVRIPSELHRKAALYSAIKKMSLNDFVRYAIDYTLTRAADPGGGAPA